MKEINVREIEKSVVSLIADDWALLTARSESGCNPMTVSWGGVGELWGKDTATVYVRQSRYTKTLIDKETHFSLCFFDNKYKEALKLCGAKSGRNADKVKETGLSAVYSENAPYFEEASLVFICRKRACQLLEESSFIDPEIKDKWYADSDMHYMYLAEIEKVLISE